MADQQGKTRVLRNNHSSASAASAHSAASAATLPMPKGEDEFQTPQDSDLDKFDFGEETQQPEESQDIDSYVEFLMKSDLLDGEQGAASEPALPKLPIAEPIADVDQVDDLPLSSLVLEIKDWKDSAKYIDFIAKGARFFNTHVGRLDATHCGAFQERARKLAKRSQSEPCFPTGFMKYLDIGHDGKVRTLKPVSLSAPPISDATMWRCSQCCHIHVKSIAESVENWMAAPGQGWKCENCNNTDTMREWFW